MSGDSPPAPQALALPAPHECLQPTMGVGADNELRMRIDGTTPPRPPLRRGIYLDPNRGLWSDPAPETEWGAGQDTKPEQNLNPGATLALDALTVDAANGGGPTLVGACLLTFAVHLVSAQNSGLVRVLGQVSAGAAPESGPLLAVANIAPGEAVASGALSIVLRAAGFVTTTLYARLWVHNATGKTVTVKAVGRRLTFAGTSREGTQ